MELISIYYILIIVQIFLALKIYNHLVKNTTRLESLTKLTIQVNIANIVYYIYKFLLINNYITIDNVSYFISILFNLNLIITIGFFIYRYYLQPVHNFFVYYDSIQLHVFNLVYIVIELWMHHYIPLYFESTILLSLMLFISWGPLYYYYKQWNYNICLYETIGIYCIISIYIAHSISIYMMDIITKN